MFIDKVSIYVKSGKGGDGCVSFRREKYVPDGGPNGGDGGRGGDVILKAQGSLNTLGAFRYKKKFIADAGEGGKGNRSSGKDAQNLIVKVPVGTIVFDEETGKFLCDMTQDGQEYTVVHGGRGGRGNQHFANSTRQAPRFAKPGDDSEEKNIILELKTIADVGLVGFPNVGKSTFLSRVTNAQPKIANYHFTTLQPNLGIVRYKDAEEFVIADIPGLIEGANEGLGLGHSFLRHVERTRLLIHVLDAASSEGRDPKEDFDIINNELYQHAEALKDRPMIVALNKSDLMPAEKALELKQYFEEKGYDTFIMSAATGKGLNEVLDSLIVKLSQIEKTPIFFSEQEIEVHAPEEKEIFTIEKENDVYYVLGDMPRRLLMSVNLDDYMSAAYFQRVLKNKGVFSALEKQGIKDGDTVNIDGFEFEYYR